MYCQHVIMWSILIIFTGSYDVFDNLVFPQEMNRQKSYSIVKTLKSIFWKGSSEDDAPVIPEHSQIQVQCLEMYLADYRNIFLNLNLSSEMKVGSIATYILEVYRQLHSQVIVLVRSSHQHIWTENKLSMVGMPVQFYTYI